MRQCATTTTTLSTLPRRYGYHKISGTGTKGAKRCPSAPCTRARADALPAPLRLARRRAEVHARAYLRKGDEALPAAVGLTLAVCALSGYCFMNIGEVCAETGEATYAGAR